jgi:holo-[acyl-carrier protein] synthase
MICGVGTDIVEIVRIREAIEKWGDHFLNKVFNSEELTYCYSKNDPVMHLAARFAAKEACIKALSRVITGQLSMKEIGVLNDEAGKPYFIISKEGFAPDLIRLHLSLSHERNYAVASVVAEQ